MFLGRTFIGNSYVLTVEKQLPTISATSIPVYVPIARHASTSTAASFCADKSHQSMHNIQTATVASGIDASSQNVVSHFRVTSNSCYVASE